ncbi:hypothetical protein EK904_000922 [Melospiza melodia maxima]|nr:hypothetical protein EK904_000922 [Melospiza melodia maxima]
MTTSKSTSNTSKQHFNQFILRQERRSVAKSDLWIAFGGARVGAAAHSRAYLQSMVRHSLLSLHEAPMGLRDTPLQKGVIRRCRALRGWGWGCLGARDAPWL